MVLEGYLYVGVSLCNLCGFNIFGASAVFSMDACCLFPQCVLVVLPLIRGVQVWWLVPGPGVLGSGGSSGAPPEHMMGTEVVADDHSWGPGGRPAVAPNHFWSLQGWWWWLTTAPAAWAGSVMPSVSACTG